MTKNSVEQKTKSPGIVMRFYRIMRFFEEHHCYILAKLVCYTIRILFACVIPPTVQIGKGCRMPHGLGIVIHQGAIIGDNTSIYQHVTIAGSGGGVPTVGCNCFIGTGAFLHGPIHVGDNVKIGANAVVLTDIPENSTAVGVPAKIIKRKDVL